MLQHMAGTLELPPSQEYLAREVNNIIGAINGIIKEISEGRDDRPLNRTRIEVMNHAVLDGLEQQEGSIPGRLRTHPVLVGGRYRGAPAEDCEYLLDRLCEWLNEIEGPQGRKSPTPSSRQ